jgi:GNAT superfamily N-acetyltransferase
VSFPPLRHLHCSPAALAQTINLRRASRVAAPSDVWTNEERKYFIAVEWVNCHEHALVNTFVKMGEVVNSRSVEEMQTFNKLEYYKKLIEGSRAPMPTVSEQDRSEERLKQTVAIIDADAAIVRVTSGSQLDDDLLDGMILLVRKNMAKFTNAAALNKKRALLQREGMCTVAAVSSSGNLYGFASYMLNVEEGGEPGERERSDYLWELHVDEDVQNKGLGSALEAVVEEASRREGVQRVTLTAHKKNRRSVHFHRLKGYQVSSAASLCWLLLCLTHTER